MEVTKGKLDGYELNIYGLADTPMHIIVEVQRILSCTQNYLDQLEVKHNLFENMQRPDRKERNV